GRVEPGGLRDPFHVHDRPEIVAPQRHQLEAMRHDRFGVGYGMTAALGEVLGLQVGANQNWRIFLDHLSWPHHVRLAAASRSGEVTSRPAEMSSTPGLSQSPSGRMIT